MEVGNREMMLAKFVITNYIKDDPNNKFRGIPVDFSDIEVINITGDRLEWAIVLQLHEKYQIPAIFRVQWRSGEFHLMVEIYRLEGHFEANPRTGEAR